MKRFDLIRSTSSCSYQYSVLPRLLDTVHASGDEFLTASTHLVTLPERQYNVNVTTSSYTFLDTV